MAPQLVLLRHGQTRWSLGGQHTGRTDIPLTADGELQAVNAGAWLRKRRERRGRDFSAVYASPLSRARRTAELAGYPDAEADDDLLEWDYGPVEGRTAVEIGLLLGQDWDIFRHGVDVLPGPRGEGAADVARRARNVIARVEPLLVDGGDVLLVSHGHLLRVLAALWLGADASFAAQLDLRTAAIGLFGTRPGRRTLEGWNLSVE